MKSSSRTKRAIVALVAITAVGAALTGCTTASSSSAASKTLTVQYTSGATGRYTIDRWVSLFKKKYPGVTVKLQPVTDTASEGTNLQVLTSNEAPDIGVLPLESSVYSDMSKGKQLVPLTDVYKSSDLNKRMGASAVSAGQYAGVSYVVPYDASYYNVVYYNKTLFAKLGISDPVNHRFTSLDQLNQVVAALKAGGSQGIGIGAADNYQASWMIDATLPNVSTTSQYNNFLTNWQSGVKATASYSGASFVDSLTRVKTMADAGDFQNGYLGATVSAAEALFEQGKTGMILGGSWFATTFASDKIPFDTDWALLPPINSNKTMVMNSYLGDAYGIPVKAKNPQLAKEFLEVMMSVAGQKVNLGGGDLPSVNDVPQSSYTSLPSTVQSMVADAATNGSAVGWSNVVPPTIGANAIEPVEQEMLNGSGTPQSVADSVEAALKKLK
jgi:raffinose/stachyose/melibiose transport system substrate-binding protein